MPSVSKMPALSPHNLLNITQRDRVTTPVEGPASPNAIDEIRQHQGQGLAVGLFRCGGALMFAAEKGHAEASQALLEGGADADVQAGGETALTRALGAGHSQIVRLLGKPGTGN